MVYHHRVLTGLAAKLNHVVFDTVIAMVVGTPDQAQRRMFEATMKITLMGPTAVYCERHGSRVSPFRLVYHDYTMSGIPIVDYIMKFV